MPARAVVITNRPQHRVPQGREGSSCGAPLGACGSYSGPHEFVLISAIPYTVWLISACAPRLCSFGPGPGVPKGIWIMAKADRVETSHSIGWILKGTRRPLILD